MLSLSQVINTATTQVRHIADAIGKMGTRTVKVLQSPNDRKFGVGPEMFDGLFKTIAVAGLIIGAAGVSVAYGVGYFAAGGALATPVGIAAATVLTGGTAVLALAALAFFARKALPS